jgi:hypothetical protein
MVNGSGPFDFLVDTGAQISTVDEELSSSLALPTKGTAAISGVAVYGSKALTELARVEAAGQVVNGVAAVVDKMAQLHAADKRIRGIIGEDFLVHFDLLIDNQHRALCLDNSGVMAAAIKGAHVPLAEPYGPDNDPPFTRPLVIEGKLGDRGSSVVFRLDSGSNIPLLYDPRGIIRSSTPPNPRLLSRPVDGAAQNFAMLPPQDLILAGKKIHQVSFVQPVNSIGGVAQKREDGLLPTQLFERIFVSYSQRFAILELR